MSKNLGFGTLRSLYAGFLGQAVWGKTDCSTKQRLRMVWLFVKVIEKSFATFVQSIDNFVTVSYFPFKTDSTCAGGIGVTWLNYGPGDSGAILRRYRAVPISPRCIAADGLFVLAGENFNLGINLGFIAGSSEKTRQTDFSCS
ncbi:MAG: hypothetical protein U1F16_02115 [Turneriella sp.]